MRHRNDDPTATRLRPSAYGLALAATAYLLTTPTLLADIHYVWTNSPSPGASFTTWTTAAHEIQEAVDASMDGDTVLVTNGVYATGGRAIVGTMLNRVAVDRQILLQSVNGPAATTIQGSPGEDGGFGLGATRCAYVASNAVLSGFTLTNGYTRNINAYRDDPQETGGGAWISPFGTVTNCVLVDNRAAIGGGGAYGGRLHGCTLRGNQALFGGGGFGGGGAWKSTLAGCQLIGNYAVYMGGGLLQGTLYQCTVVSNTAGYEGGGIASSTAWNCVLRGNWSHGDGGGALYGTLYNCLLTGNSSDNRGAGAAGDSFSGIRVALFNCTVSKNPSGYGGVSYGSVYNTIVTLNTPDIYQTTTDHSFVGGDPGFLDEAGGDYRLRGDSPCIDAGQTQAWMFASLDLAGNPRLFNVTVDIGAYEFTMTTEVNLFLQGPYGTNGMSTALRDSSRVPLSSPYGGDTREAPSIPTNATDWVLLELVDTNDNSVVDAKSALLQSDGRVVDEQGNRGIRLACSLGRYRLMAKHRNHLTVMSSRPIAYTNALVIYDFTTGPDKCLGGTNACVELEPGVWGLIAGDADGDGKITPTDRKIVEQQMGRTGYLSGDLNLDGKVDGDDE